MNVSRVVSALSYEPADTSERILESPLAIALRTAAANWPDRPALIEGLSEPAARRRWTFSEALREAENVGRALALRFRPGEHVAIWAANSPEWFFVEFGAVLAGLTLVTINPAYVAAELGFVLKQSHARGVVVQDHYRGRDLLAAVAAARQTLSGLLEQERGAIVLSVPTMLQRILDEPSIGTRDISSWRLVSLGGAPVPPALIRRVDERGVTAVIGYGQTEASPYLSHTLPDDPHPDWVDTVGRPLPQTEIKIVNPDSGEVLPRGKIGEICGRGYGIMKDYFENPAGTAAAIDSEGWLHTGDLGSLDEHGYCRVHGRIKDLIIRGGENIYPPEIEDVLHTHAAILGASVVGVPDADWGEIPVAFVQAKPEARPSAEELETFSRERLASYKAPRVWRFVDQFPQTASGKIQKFALREIYLDAGARRGR